MALVRCSCKQESTLQLCAGYFDESTDEDGENLCYAIAGFIGSQHATAILDLRWKDLLDEYEIEYFKASELNAGEGQFKKFRDDPQATEWRKFSEREKGIFKEIKTKFTDCFLGCRGLYAIGAALMLPDYRRIMDEYPQARKNLPEPYYVCCSLALVEAGVLMRNENQGMPRDDLGFLRPIFDAHEVYSGRAKMAFDGFCQRNPISSKYLLPLHYESDMEYISLQAADNIAFEVRKLAINRRFKNIRERQSLTRIKEARRLLIVYDVNYDALKILSDAQEAEVFPINPIKYEFPSEEQS